MLRLDYVLPFWTHIDRSMMLLPIATTITYAIMTNAYQLAQSRSLRVYVGTPTRHIEARLVTASFREILVTEIEESRKMSLLKRSALKVGCALLCYPLGDT
jgi:5-formaminoimidazole-4-carboxamide-1-beta-D-ribofuranosyl 5'-monophosphate synthetase